MYTTQLSQNDIAVNEFLATNGNDTHKVYSEMFLNYGQLLAQYRNEDGQPYDQTFIEDRFFEMQETLKLIGSIQVTQEEAQGNKAA